MSDKLYTMDNITGYADDIARQYCDENKINAYEVFFRDYLSDKFSEATEREQEIYFGKLQAKIHGIRLIKDNNILVVGKDLFMPDMSDIFIQIGEHYKS